VKSSHLLYRVIEPLPDREGVAPDRRRRNCTARERQILAQELSGSSIGHRAAPFGEEVAQLRQGALKLYPSKGRLVGNHTGCTLTHRQQRRNCLEIKGLGKAASVGRALRAAAVDFARVTYPLGPWLAIATTNGKPNAGEISWDFGKIIRYRWKSS
jgi:hypothetical protein